MNLNQLIECVVKEKCTAYPCKRIKVKWNKGENTNLVSENKSSLPDENLNHNLGKYFMEHLQIQVGRVSIKNPLINKFIKTYSPPTVKHLFDDKLEEMESKYFSGFQSTNQDVRNYFVLRSSNVYQSRSLYRLRHIILTRNLNI